MFIGWETERHPLDNFIRLGARYMLQVALEQEVEDYLGRVLPIIGVHAERMTGATVISQER